MWFRFWRSAVRAAAEKDRVVGGRNPTLARGRHDEADSPGMTQLRLHLEGPHAALGDVPAADVANLILWTETAIMRAASVVLGRPKTGTGRFEEPIERSSRLLLVGVEEGSVQPVLELPQAEGTDDALLLESDTLGEAALERVLDALTDPTPQPVIAKAVLELAEKVHIGDDRYDKLVLERNGDRRKPRQAVLDGAVRSRLRAYVDAVPPPPVRTDEVSGVLVEADFEARTARLRTPAGPVVVGFDEQLDDAIQAALRQPAILVGAVSYDPKTNTARSVALMRLVRGEQLSLGVDPTDFWRTYSVRELARQQGVEPADLTAPVELTAEEREAFLSAVAELD